MGQVRPVESAATWSLTASMSGRRARSSLPPPPARPLLRGGRSPLLLDIQGRPEDFDPTSQGFAHHQVLATGYVVVMPNPGGAWATTRDSVGSSPGSGRSPVPPTSRPGATRSSAGTWRMPTGKPSEVLLRRPPGRVSRIVGHSDRFRAAVIGAPVVDVLSMFGISDPTSAPRRPRHFSPPRSRRSSCGSTRCSPTPCVWGRPFSYS